ncbi:MAG: PD-(D/E)XK nuclease family protein [Anaerolineaceae bacterium]|nr:PD-(D/E)XK nuclease family protein [Anaerolineaceae bacterium]
MANTLYLTPDLDTAFHSIQGSIATTREAHPLAAITILLPDSATVQTVRTRLGDTIGVHLHQFYGLGQKIIDHLGLPVHLVSDPSIRRLVRQILNQMDREGRLTTFQAVWKTPGFHQVLLEWLREMKSQGIEPEAVAAHIAASDQERDRQLAGFYSAYQAFLRQHDFSDGDGLLWLAAEALEHNPQPSIDQRLFIALGFDQFNPLQIRILRAFARCCNNFHIYLAWDPQRPPTSLALSRLAQTRQILEEALKPNTLALNPTGPVDPLLDHLRRTVFEPVRAAKPAAERSRAALRLVAAPSREAEVRWALKAIKRLLLDGATPDQIALLAPTQGVYQRIVEVVGGEYGLPLQVEHSLRDNPAIAALINLLGLSPDFPWRETLDALRSPYICQPWLTQEQIGQLDQLSRERPVLGGRDQWRYALQPILHSSTADDAEDDDFGASRLASRLAPEALAAIESGLTAFFDHLTPPEAANCRDYSLWLQQAVLGLFPEPEEDVEEAESGQPAQPPSLMMTRCCQTSPYARRDTQALSLAAQAIRSLVEAAELVAQPGEEAISWMEFRTELIQLLPGLKIPADPLQAGVRYAALETGRSQMVDHLFVLGLAEGEFPHLPAPDVLYAPHEREAHSLPLIRLRSGDQASLWWQVLSSCRRSLTLLRPSLDEKGAPWLPSSYWEAVQAAAQAVFPDLRETELPILSQPNLDDAASPTELLVALVNGGALSVPDELRQAWQTSQFAYQIMSQRQSWHPIPEHEGILQDPIILSELSQRYASNHNWSASRLNRYGNCPYSFFAQVILGLEERAAPEEGFDAMQRGTLLHAILERLFNKLAAASLGLTPANLPEIETLLERCCTSAFHRAPERYGFQPGKLWEYEQAELRRMLVVLLRSECEQNGESPRFHPYQQEVRFGIRGGQLPELRIENEDGFQFFLHGVIDRIDRDQDGRLRLIDYKSGSTMYSKPDILKGLAFQSPFYALAAEQLIQEAQVAESYYLHIPKRKPSGHLTFTGGVAPDATVSAAVDRAVLFVQNIRQGLFPVLPAKFGVGQNACTSTCEFSAMCRVDRHAISKARREGTL